MDSAFRQMILVEPTRDNGLKISDQARALSSTRTKIVTKVAFLTTSLTVKELTSGRMGKCSKESFFKVASTALVSGKAERATHTWENGRIISQAVMEFTFGKMEISMRGSGLSRLNMGRERICLLTRISILVHMRKEFLEDMANTVGKAVHATLASSKTEKRRAKVSGRRTKSQQTVISIPVSTTTT